MSVGASYRQDGWNPMEEWTQLDDIAASIVERLAEKGAPAEYNGKNGWGIIHGPGSEGLFNTINKPANSNRRGGQRREGPPANCPPVAPHDAGRIGRSLICGGEDHCAAPSRIRRSR